MDSDHQGKVYLSGHLLTGGSSIQGETNKYKGDYGEIYTLDTIHDTLHVKLEDEEITIQNHDQQRQSFIKNILTCKDFHTIKSLHVRIKIKQKGATYGAQQKVA